MPKGRKKVINNSNCNKKPYRKQTIPKAVREQCWIASFGKVFEHKCYVDWCENLINPFDYHVGHDQPESKGGTLDINNINEFEDLAKSIADAPTAIAFNETYLEQTKD